MNLGFEHAIDLEEKLALGRPLIIKLGFDPTSPDLHLGHYVVMRGAKKLQDLGHTVVIIVGDFTAAIGDPSGRNLLRPPLSDADIQVNAQTYMEQVFMVLDQEKTLVKKNSTWLNPLTLKDTLSLLSLVTVSQILARDDFSKRFNAQIPIYMHEMVYPLMQGLDSVVVQADVELGGTDQTFNLMMGRQLQKNRNQAEQSVLTFPLLVGLDGVKKMSKSLGNYIGFHDTPTDQFGKIMSISDDTMWLYWKIIGEKTETEILDMQNSGENPKNIKMDLAQNVVAIFYGSEKALDARRAFTERFSHRMEQNLDDVEQIHLNIKEDTISIAHVLKHLGMATSVSDAGRKMEQKGVRLDQVAITDKRAQVHKGDEFLLSVGKVHLKRVKI